MAIRSVHEFEDILHGVVVETLGWQDNPNNVRIGWQTEGAPGFKITDEVIFITATPVEDEYSKQYDVVFEEGSPEYVIYRGFTRVMELYVIGYGYNSLSNLYNLMIGMHTDSARRSLNREGIYYIPLSIAPKRIPELFQAQWWERADLSLRFYEANSFEEPIQTVDSIDVEVNNAEGLLTEFTVNR